MFQMSPKWGELEVLYESLRGHEITQICAAVSRKVVKFGLGKQRALQGLNFPEDFSVAVVCERFGIERAKLAEQCVARDCRGMMDAEKPFERCAAGIQRFESLTRAFRHERVPEPIAAVLFALKRCRHSGKRLAANALRFARDDIRAKPGLRQRNLKACCLEPILQRPTERETFERLVKFRFGRGHGTVWGRRASAANSNFYSDGFSPLFAASSLKKRHRPLFQAREMLFRSGKVRRDSCDDSKTKAQGNFRWLMPAKREPGPHQDWNGGSQNPTDRRSEQDECRCRQRGCCDMN